MPRVLPSPQLLLSLLHRAGGVSLRVYRADDGEVRATFQPSSSNPSIG